MEDAIARAGEVLTFRDSLNAETDRGCAMMAAAYLSDQLAVLLSANLVHEGSVSDHLLARCLESLCDRIDLAYALGLIPAKARKDLHLIRRIRNDFGHTASPLTFLSGSIADRCGELYYTVHAREASPRQHFISSAVSLCGLIHGRTDLSKRPSVPADVVINEAFRQQVAEVVDESLPGDDEEFATRLMLNAGRSVLKLKQTQSD